MCCAAALLSLLPGHQESSAEWITALADEELGTDMLYSEADPLENIVEEVHLKGLGHLTLQSISRAHRHTLTHTGLMHWESASALARFILSHPSIFAGKNLNLHVNQIMFGITVCMIWKGFKT